MTPECNVRNRTLFVADNLAILRGINSGSVDLIATDPPFNACRTFNAPLGSRAAGQQFEDRWRWDAVTQEWFDTLALEHGGVKEVIETAAVLEGGQIRNGRLSGRVKNSMAAFLVFMAPRLIEMRRILKPTGSLFLRGHRRQPPRRASRRYGPRRHARCRR